MRIAIYSRKSRFVEGSESIENQIEMCKEYIKRNFKNVEDILIYEDEGFSGKDTDRPQFKKLMQAAENKMFDVIICYRLDRISRNIADFAKIIDELQKYNIDFVSIKEQFDTSSPMGRAMMYISSVFAQLERETIAERVKDNLLELAKEGRWLGGTPPLGYIQNGKGKEAILELESDYSEIVKQMFDIYIREDSASRVLKWTIRNKIKSRSNKNFNYNTIRQVLSNPVYCVADLNFYNYAKENNMIICNPKEEFEANKTKGIMCYNKLENATSKRTFREKNEWIIAIGEHESLVESETWIKVQDRRKVNAVKAPGLGTSHEALLSGLLRCANCESTFRVTASYRNNKRTHYYYKCKTKAVSNTLLCNVKNINGLEADTKIIDYLKQLRANPKAISKLYDVHGDELKSNNIFDEIKSLEKLIEENDNKIDKLTDELAEDSSSSKYIKRKIDKLDSEIKEMNKKITELKSSQNECKINEMNVKIFKEYLDYFVDNLDNLSIEEQRALVKIVIKEIKWDGENLHVTPRL